MRPTTRRSIPLACMLVLGAAAPAGAQTIEREKSIQRGTLDRMEGEPLPPEALDSLTDWSGSETIRDAILDNKVVAIGLVSMLQPTSWMTISKLTRMQRDLSDRGVAVALIHPDLGWEQMQEKRSAGEIEIPVARDAGGAFAEAMRADDYPDLYVIDRGGNLRYADIHTGSLRAALERLARERAADARAATDPSDPPAPSSSAQTDAEQSPDEQTPDEPSPDEPSPAPREATADDYAGADWPARKEHVTRAINDIQGEPLPLALGEHEQWIAGELDLDAQRPKLLYFWGSFCGYPCRESQPVIQSIHTKHKDKIDVIGIGVYDNREEFTQAVAQLETPYPQMHDEDATLYEEIGIRSAAHVIIMSSDGIVRWQGHGLHDQIPAIVEQMLDADPGVGG